MLMTKKKILATLVATTLVVSTIMPNVVLALDTVEPTETTVETTETEPAVTEPTSFPEETSETSAEPAETTEETINDTISDSTTPSDITETSVEETQPSTEDSAPSTSETSVEATEPTESSVDTSESIIETEFNQSIVIDGIKITVKADKGVFPEGAELTARKVTKLAINQEDNLVSSMTFDICIKLDGNEIEPDTSKGQVTVTFFDERFADQNLDAAIYHTSDDKVTEEMDITTVDGGAEVTTDSFSLYTVEFTYENMQFVLDGNSSIALSTILEKVGLIGEVTDVEISDTSLVEYKDGNVYAIKEFTSTEWMKVTINGITYTIIITDDPSVPEDAYAGVDAYAVLYDTGILAFQKGEDELSIYGNKVESWLIPTAYPADDPDTTDVNESYPDWYASADNIIKVVFVDNIKGITSLRYYFYGLSNVDTFENLNRLDTKDITSFYGLFMNCSSVEELDLSSWDIHNVTNISAIFNGCSSVKTINLSNWNFRAINTTGGALSGCTALKTLDLSNTKLPADTYNAGLCLGWHMAGSGCALDEVIVNNIDLSQTTSLNGFLSIPAKKVTGLTTWDVSNVITISSLFNGNNLVEDIDISGWDLRNMRNTSGSAIWSGCVKLKTLNMSNVKMPADTAASNFQLGWGNISVTLESINVTNLDLSETTSLNGFLTCPANEIIGLDTWNTSNVTNFSSLFNGQRYVTSLDLSNFTFKSGDNINIMLVNTYSLETLVLPTSVNNITFDINENSFNIDGTWKNESDTIFDSSEIVVGGTYTKIENIAQVGKNAYAILYDNGDLVFQYGNIPEEDTVAVVSSWKLVDGEHPWTDTSYRNQVKTIIFKNKIVGFTNGNTMFRYLAELTSIENLDNLDVSTITTMEYMFADDKKLTSIDITGWDTSNVTSFKWWFASSSSMGLKEVIGSENLVTSSATSIRTMFQNCINLGHLDMSNWDTSNVNDMQYTFAYTGLEELDLSSFDFSNVGSNTTSFIASVSTLKKVVLPETINTVSITGYNKSSNNWVKNDTELVSYTQLTSAGTYEKHIKTIKFMPTSNVSDAVTIYLSSVQPVKAIPESLLNITQNDRGEAFIGWFDYNDNQFTGTEVNRNVENEYFAKYEHTVQTAIYGEDMYLVEYLDDSGHRTAVYQKGTDLDSEYGTWIGTYFVSDVPKSVSSFGYVQYEPNRSRTADKIVIKDRLTNLPEGSRMFKLGHTSNRPMTYVNLDYIDMSTTTHISFLQFCNGNCVTTGLDKISNWDVSHVTDLSDAFGSVEFNNNDIGDLGDWDVSNVTNFQNIFNGCLGGLPKGIDRWNTSSATNMYGAFMRSDITDTDIIKDWDVSNVTTFESAFYNCNALINVTLNWDMGSATTMTNMFKEDKKLESITGNSNYVATSAQNNMSNMFYECNALRDISGLAKWDTSNVTDMSYMFYNAYKLYDLDALSEWDVSNVTTMTGMFYAYYANKSVLRDISGLTNWETSSLISMQQMFKNQKYIASIEALRNWDVSNVTNMGELFYNNSSLKSLEPLTDWTTSSLTNMSLTFTGCSSLTSLEGLENWDVSQVSTMNNTFGSCSNVSDFSAIENWTTTSLSTISNIFNNCRKLTEIDLSNWDLSRIGSASSKSNSAFNACTGLVKITLPESFTVNANDDIDGSSVVFDTVWIYEPTDAPVESLTTILYNFTLENAGTYYKQYEITLYPMGGTVIPKKVETNIFDGVSELPIPERPGYTFLGWYDSTGTKRESINSGEYVSKLFAKWELANVYTLVLDPNLEGYDPITVELAPDDYYVLDSDIFGDLKAHYEFIHWSERKSNTGEMFDDKTEIINLAEVGTTYTLYAQWVSHQQIPVNFHYINILTGEETSKGTQAVSLNSPYTLTTDLNVLNRSQYDEILYTALESDLDCVHFNADEHELFTMDWQYSFTIKGENYDDNFGTRREDQVLITDVNLVPSWNGNYYSSSSNAHKWTIADYDKDFYVYYLPAARAKVYFNSQQAESLPVELKLIIDGQEYASGEYEVEIPRYMDGAPNVTNTYNSKTVPYTPDWYSKWEYYYNISDLAKIIKNYIDDHGGYFNYPVNLYGTSQWGGEYYKYDHCYKTVEEAQSTYDGGSISYYSKQAPYMYYCHFTQDKLPGISLLFSMDIVYDFNGGYYAYDNTITDDQYMMFYSQMYLTGPINQFTNYPYVYRGARDGYVFDGWWTEPEGGIQLIKATENRGYLSKPIDLAPCPVVDYTDSWQTKLMEGTNVKGSADAFHSTNYHFVTMYAHWIPEDEWTPDPTCPDVDPRNMLDNDRDTRYIEYATVTVYNSHNTSKPVQSYEMDIPQKYKFNHSDIYSIPTDQQNPSKWEDYIFVGWFSEPNGQGMQLQDSYIEYEPGQHNWYAYWTTPGDAIYFDLYGYTVHPNEATLTFGDNMYKDYVKPDVYPAKAYGKEIVSAYMIPIVRTNEDYRFLGWYDEDGHQLAVGDPLVNGTTYIAHWTQIGSIDEFSYDVKITYNNGTNMITLPSSYPRKVTLNFNIQVQAENNYVIPKGAIRVYMPDSMYNLLDTNKIGNYANISNGRYFLGTYINPREPLADIPYAQESSGYYYYYYVENGVEISGGATFTSSKSVSLNYLRYTDVYGNGYNGSTTEPKLYTSGPFIIVIDTNLDGVPEIIEERYLYGESVKTNTSDPHSKFENLAIAGEMYTDWRNTWGERPSDADDYIYVRWSLSNQSGNTYYNNSYMKYYYNMVQANYGESIVYSTPGTYDGAEYDSDGGYIVIKYPKSRFSYNAQRGTIRQPFNITATPLYTYSTNDKFDYNITRTGTVSWNWAESGPLTLYGHDLWANMGRYSNGYVTISNTNNEIQKQRQVAYYDESAEGFSWFALYAQRKLAGSNTTGVTIKPGDISYVSAACDNFYMLEPATGRTILTKDDYKITGYTWCIFDGYSAEFVDEVSTATGLSSSDITPVLRDSKVRIYVQYNDSDEWVLYNSTTGYSVEDNSNFDNCKNYSDSVIDVNFQKGDYRTLYTSNGRNIVGIRVEADFEENSNYQVICIIPKITLLSTPNTKKFAKMDFDQQVDSVICMHDFDIHQFDHDVNYTSGNWGHNLIFDGDVGLCDWFLTSDACDIDLRNNIRIANNSGISDRYTIKSYEDGEMRISLEAINQAQNQTYYMPIDSGDYYVLLPEDTSIVSQTCYFGGASYANTSYILSLDNSTAYGSNMIHGNSREILSSDKVTTETIENWENSGRTMVIYHFKNLTEGYTFKELEYYNSVWVTLTLRRNLPEYNGYAANIASMFIDTTGTWYTNDFNTYNNYNDSSLVHTYFNNLNDANSANSKSIAYNQQSFNFYKKADSPDPISEGHQTGFNEFMANSSNKFGITAEVFPGENYTYKIIWSQAAKDSSDNDNESDSLRFCTRLDGVGGFVDMTTPTIKGIVYLDDDHVDYEEVTVSPKVWYCKDPNFAQTENFNLIDVNGIELTEANGWYTEPKLDLDEKVYGIFFDYSTDDQGRTVYLKGDSYVNVNIYQKNLANTAQTFTSDSKLAMNNFTGTKYGGLMTGTVVIPNITISVESKPAYGTIDHPTDVCYEQDLIYYWTIKNNENRNIENVIVTFDIPEQVNCQNGKIKIGNVSILDSANIKDVSIENGKVTLTIKNLESSQVTSNAVVNITEATYVTETRNNILIINQGFITGYNDIIPSDEQKENLQTDITYHEVFNVPDPTGVANSILPYMTIFAIFSIAGISYTVFKKKRKYE